MTYSRFFVHAFYRLFSLIGFAVYRACEITVSPVMYLLRASPAAADLAILPRIKAIYFTVIGHLKPVYRESYETNGLSIASLRN